MSRLNSDTVCCRDNSIVRLSELFFAVLLVAQTCEQCTCQFWLRDWLEEQGGQSSGKPGSVREFSSCQRIVRELTFVRVMSGKNLARETVV